MAAKRDEGVDALEVVAADLRAGVRAEAQRVAAQQGDVAIEQPLARLNLIGSDTPISASKASAARPPRS